MTCPFIIYWIRWTQLWIGPRLYQSIMDAPNLRDQMPNTKMSQMLYNCDNVQYQFYLFSNNLLHWWPVVIAMWGIQNFHCKSFRDIFLGSPNSSIIEQHNLALSSQVNNTGGIFFLQWSRGLGVGKFEFAWTSLIESGGLWLAPMIIPTNTSRWQLPECSMINSDRQTSSRGFPTFGRLSPPLPKQCENSARFSLEENIKTVSSSKENLET